MKRQLVSIMTSSLLVVFSQVGLSDQPSEAQRRACLQALNAIAEQASESPYEQSPSFSANQNSGISSGLLGSRYNFWSGLYGVLRRVTSRRWAYSLVESQIPRFKVIRYDQLPQMQVRPAEGFDLGRDFFQQLARHQYSSDFSSWFDRLHAESVQRFGQATLTPVLIAEDNIERVVDTRLLGTTSFVGHLLNSQPVQIVLLNSNRDSGSDVPSALRSDVSHILGNTSIGSLLSDYGQEFYGVQRFGNGVYGVVLSLPGPGLPMQFGGMQFFNQQTLESAQGLFWELRPFVNGRIDDLRPFIHIDGTLSLYPSVLGENLRDSDGNIFRPGLLAEKFQEMGVEINGRSYVDEMNSPAYAASMSEFLSGFTAGIGEEARVREAIRGYLENLFEMERSPREQLLLRHIVQKAVNLRAWEIHVNSRPGRDAPDIEFLFIEEVLSLLGRSSLSAEELLFKPIVPLAAPQAAALATSQPWVAVDYVELQIGSNVVIKVADRDQDSWEHPHLKPNHMIAAELLRLEIDDQFLVHYVFKVRWRDDVSPGIVNQEFRFSQGEMSALGIYTYETGLPSIIARRREQNRESDAAYQPIQSLGVADSGEIDPGVQSIVEDAYRETERSLRPQQYTDRHGPSGPTPGKYQMNSHSDALARGVSELSNGSPVLFAHHNRTRTHLFLTGEKGRVEVWDYNELTKLYTLEKNERNGYDGYRAISTMGSSYFVTYEPQSGGRSDSPTIRKVSDGTAIASAHPDGYVTTVISPDERYAHIIGLGYPLSFYLPSGDDMGDIFSDDHDPYLKAFWDSAREVRSQIPGNTMGDYFNNALVTPNGEYLIITTNGFTGTNDYIGVIRTVDNFFLGTVNSGVQDIIDIHVTSDSRHLVVERKDSDNPEVFEIIGDGAPETTNVRVRDFED